LWGFGPSLSRVFGRLDPVSIVPIVCIVLYLIALALDPRAIFSGGASFFGLLSPSSKSLFLLGSTAPHDLQMGRYCTLITAIYLHGGLLHIAFNVLWIKSLGPEVQRAFGPGRFFVIWTAAGVLGFVLSDLVPGPPSVGASGSIFVLMAALIVYGRAVGASTMTRQIIQWAVILGAMGFLMRGVDNFAHIGGFLGGWIMATIYRPQIGRAEGRGTTLTALVLIAITGISFVWSIVSGLALLRG
jgi:rhomboid protease GluP